MSSIIITAALAIFAIGALAIPLATLIRMARNRPAGIGGAYDHLPITANEGFKGGRAYCSDVPIKEGSLVAIDPSDPDKIVPWYPADPGDPDAEPPVEPTPAAKPLGFATACNYDGENASSVEPDCAIGVNFLGLLSETADVLMDPSSGPASAGECTKLYAAAWEDENGVACAGVTATPDDPLGQPCIGWTVLDTSTGGMVGLAPPNPSGATAADLEELKLNPIKVTDETAYDQDNGLLDLTSFGLVGTLKVLNSEGWDPQNDWPLCLMEQCGEIKFVILGGLFKAPGIDYAII